ALKKKLEELAKEQNRSLNNLIVTILENSTKK
ncbi:MAG TPA: DNA-binding protein, partial [Desulfosporosinus sp.]|nr:DNA-binding protein [Desulfosporosinus sp.]